MPPRWPRKPDRADPEYRRLDDRMNFAVHVALFAATNSGLWFFRTLGSTSELGVPGGLAVTPTVTGVWSLLLAVHALYVFAIARYSVPAAPSGAGQKARATANSKPKQTPPAKAKPKPQAKAKAPPASKPISQPGSGFQPTTEKKSSKK